MSKVEARQVDRETLELSWTGGGGGCAGEVLGSCGLTDVHAYVCTVVGVQGKS